MAFFSDIILQVETFEDRNLLSKILVKLHFILPNFLSEKKFWESCEMLSIIYLKRNFVEKPEYLQLYISVLL